MFVIFSQLAPKEAGDFGVELQKLGGFGAKAALRQDRVRTTHWGIRCVRLHVTRNVKGMTDDGSCRVEGVKQELQHKYGSFIKRVRNLEYIYIH